MNKKINFLFAVCISFVAGHASAMPIYATGGNVTVDILRSDSGYSNDIYAFTQSLTLSDARRIGVDNDTSVKSFDLGTFAAGTELIFGIANGNGDSFFSGDPSRNLDGLSHALMESTAENSWKLGFEDLLGGGDFDFNDAVFVVKQSASVPEPSTLGLLVAGVLSLVVVRRKFATAENHHGGLFRFIAPQDLHN